MHPSMNIFGIEGTQTEQIQKHFDTMKLEAVKAYDYNCIDATALGAALVNIGNLEHEISHICTKINMEREKMWTILQEHNVVDLD